MVRKNGTHLKAYLFPFEMDPFQRPLRPFQEPNWDPEVPLRSSPQLPSLIFYPSHLTATPLFPFHSINIQSCEGVVEFKNESEVCETGHPLKCAKGHNANIPDERAMVLLECTPDYFLFVRNALQLRVTHEDIQGKEVLNAGQAWNRRGYN